MMISSKYFFLPSGNLTQVWKITFFLTWKRTISMAIFNSYVKLPKVSKFSITMRGPPSYDVSWFHSPHENYSHCVLGTINHNDIGVMFTNLAIIDQLYIPWKTYIFPWSPFGFPFCDSQWGPTVQQHSNLAGPRTIPSFVTEVTGTIWLSADVPSSLESILILFAI